MIPTEVASPSQRKRKLPKPNFKKSLIVILIVALAASGFFAASLLMKYSPKMSTEVVKNSTVSKVLYGYAENSATSKRNESQVGAFCYVFTSAESKPARLPALACDPKVNENVVLFEKADGSFRIDPQYTPSSRNIILIYMWSTFALSLFSGLGLVMIRRKESTRKNTQDAKS